MIYCMQKWLKVMVSMTNDNNQPDLDLINRVQTARMMHDQTARPSDYTAVYWIESKRKRGDYPALTSNAGEWRVKLSIENVDEVWEKIKRATKNGELGYKSKVSTRPAAKQAHPDERLLCIRTYNADDIEDVARVKTMLMNMGLDENLTYSRDKTTAD
jgi:Basophilic leukemia-expressed protein Bles03